MSALPVIAVSAVCLGFGLLAYRLLRPIPSAELPGPHNNWERSEPRSERAGFYESGIGLSGDCLIDSHDGSHV